MELMQQMAGQFLEQQRCVHRATLQMYACTKQQSEIIRQILQDMGQYEVLTVESRAISAALDDTLMQLQQTIGMQRDFIDDLVHKMEVIQRHVGRGSSAGLERVPLYGTDSAARFGSAQTSQDARSACGVIRPCKSAVRGRRRRSSSVQKAGCTRMRRLPGAGARTRAPWLLARPPGDK